MAKNITFFLWGTLETACWFLVAMYNPNVYPIIAVPIAIGGISTLMLIILCGFAIAEHWNDGKK